MNKPRTAVSVAFFSNGIAAGSFMIRIPDFKEKLEISNGRFGFALFVLMIGVLISIQLAGLLAAKYGSKTIAIPATVAMAVAMCLVAMTPNYITFILALLIFGFTLATQDISMNAHAIAVEREYAARFMSTFHGVFSIGGLVGALIAGVFAQIELDLFTHAVIVGIPMSVVAVALRNWWLPASVDIHPIEKKSKRASRPRVFWILGILGFCGQVGEGAAGDWGAILARETFNASPLLSALPYVIFSAAMVIGRLLGDRIISRYSASAVLSWGGFISGGGLILGLLIGGISGQIFGWLTLGAGLSILIPILFSESGRIAQRDYPDTIAPSEGVAMVSGIAYFGFMAGPPIIGFLSSIIDLRWAMMVPGVLALTLGIAARSVVKN